MHILTQLLAILSALALLMAVVIAYMSLISVAIQLRDYPKYRRTHRALLTGAVRLDPGRSNGGVAVFLPPGEKKSASTIIYNRRDRDISLIGGGFLSNYLLTWLDPYSLYWRLRIARLAERLSEGDDPRAALRAERLSNIL